MTNDSTREGGRVGISRRRALQLIASTAAATGIAGASGTASAQSASTGVPTPRLHVDGNLLKDPSGNTVRLRGVNIADPYRIHQFRREDGKTAAQSVEYFTSEEKGWYARVIRLPLQPQDIADKPSPWVAHHELDEDPEGYVDREDEVGYYEPGLFDADDLLAYLEAYVDPFVERCAERGVYCILDFHRHWGPDEWTGEDLAEEVTMFWETVAPRYAEETQVLYEVYNEPTMPGMWDDPFELDWVADVWYDWLEQAQPWVDTIREHAPETIVIVGSPGWTQSPEGALLEPFEGENLAYAYHIYPDHEASQAQDWEDVTINGQGVAGVYEEFPMFVSEWGWEGVDETVEADYGEPLLEWMEASDAIHWQAWNLSARWGDLESVADDECAELPCEWTYDDSDGSFTEFVRVALEETRDDALPEDSEPESEPDPIDVGEYEARPHPDVESGRYADVDGSGDVGSNDVVAFFEHFESETVQDNADAFDFNGSGSVGFEDVVALFELV